MHKYESDEGKVDQLIKQAEHDYEVIQRQVTYLEGTEQTGVILQQSHIWCWPWLCMVAQSLITLPLHNMLSPLTLPFSSLNNSIQNWPILNKMMYNILKKLWHQKVINLHTSPTNIFDTLVALHHSSFWAHGCYKICRGTSVGALNRSGWENFCKCHPLSRKRYEIGLWSLWNTNRKF